jgi:exopolysaccharide production protein ExoZ
MKTLYGIQYLRALAALAVVFFHAAERTGGQFRIGAAGVDVFFVISGFIMWVMSERRLTTPLQFLLDRVERIAPLYWIVTVIMIVGAIAGLFPNMTLTIAHTLGSMLFIPVRSPSNGDVWPVLVQGWTLDFEMFFYAVFAVALVLPRRFRLPFIAGLFTAFVLAGLWFRPQSSLLLTYTRPIILEFVAGAILGRFWTEGKVPGRAIGLFLVALSLCGFASVQLLHLDFDEFTCGPLAIALVLGAVAVEASGTLPRLPLLAHLGNGSYSIYLWHTLAISIVTKVAAPFALPQIMAVLLSALFGTLIGLAAHEAAEKPLRDCFKRFRWRRSHPSLA